MDFSLRGGGQDQKSGKSSQGRWHSLKLDGQSELYVARGEWSCVQELTGFLAAHGNVLMGEEK